jgi:hypothetical protein
LSGVCRDCNADPDAPQACRVDAALDQLYALPTSIKTFVVGFAFGGISPNLNCHAVHGRTARVRCPSVTRDNCRDSTDACYYDANNQADLSAAFNDIIDEVVSCSYQLGQFPGNLDRLWSYLDWDPGPGLDLTRLERYSSWNHNGFLNQVEFFGAACDALKAGLATPVMIYGCPDTGG